MARAAPLCCKVNKRGTRLAKYLEQATTSNTIKLQRRSVFFRPFTLKRLIFAFSFYSYASDPGSEI